MRCRSPTPRASRRSAGRSRPTHTLAKHYTWANRLVAVVSDGSAVLGLGDIGPAASLPVMEGKSALFKTFGGLDSIPIVLATKDPDEIVETLIRLRPTFGAVNLEDISAPRCFEIERRVIEALDCPVMHDDQHGTAIVVLAALLGAAKVLDRDMHDAARGHLRCRRRGCGLREHPAGQGDSGYHGAGLARASCTPAATDLNPFKAELAAAHQPARAAPAAWPRRSTAPMCSSGCPAGVVPEELIATMAPGGIVFALSNPDPEIHPDVAAKYAAVVATGRSDFPNQINNVLAFPGVFRGALDAGARRITEKMKVAAAEAIFSVVGDDLAPDHIVPSPLDPRVGPAVAAAVAAGVEGLNRSVEPAPAGSPLALGLLLAPADRGAAPSRTVASMAVGAGAERRVGAAGPALRRGAAVLRHRRARRDDAGPVGRAGFRRRSASCPGFTGQLLQRFAARRVGALRRAGLPRHGRRRCPKASPPATTPPPRRTSPRWR